MTDWLGLRDEEILEIEKRLTGYFRVRLSNMIFNEWGEDLPMVTLLRLVAYMKSHPDAAAARVLAESAGNRVDELMPLLISMARLVVQETVRVAKRSGLYRQEAFDSAAVEDAHVKAHRAALRREAILELLGEAKCHCTPKEWRALVMWSEGASYREIGDALKIAPRSVGPCLKRARERIRKRMGEA